MAGEIFTDGMPHGFLAPMYDDGYAVQPELVDPEFATALLAELKGHNMYSRGGSEVGRDPGVFHHHAIVNKLGELPLLAEYRNALNDAITDVSGFAFEHLTWLTVRACPVRSMSSRIHRNDAKSGPWLAALTVAGSGSINMYDDDVIEDEELTLHGDRYDPEPRVSSPMTTGDAWGAYTKEWSVPHAGGLNTSIEPKVIVLLYGWDVRGKYPFKSEQSDWSDFDDWEEQES